MARRVDAGYELAKETAREKGLRIPMAEGKLRMLINILAVLAVATALVYRFGPPYMAKRRTKGAAEWPEAVATIQSAKMELVERVGHLRRSVPFFDFSYVVENDYYSGRFGVRVDETRADALIREWIDTKLAVRYDPKRPSIFSLPDEMFIDGFRVATVREFELVSQH